jgi:hypothetical protein
MPVWTKNLLGQVWFGAEACQRSETPKAFASPLNTGTCSGINPCITVRGSLVGVHVVGDKADHRSGRRRSQTGAKYLICHVREGLVRIKRRNARTRGREAGPLSRSDRSALKRRTLTLFMIASFWRYNRKLSESADIDLHFDTVSHCGHPNVPSIVRQMSLVCSARKFKDWQLFFPPRPQRAVEIVTAKRVSAISRRAVAALASRRPSPLSCATARPCGSRPCSAPS